MLKLVMFIGISFTIWAQAEDANSKWYKQFRDEVTTQRAIVSYYEGTYIIGLRYQGATSPQVWYLPAFFATEKAFNSPSLSEIRSQQKYLCDVHGQPFQPLQYTYTPRHRDWSDQYGYGYYYTTGYAYFVDEIGACEPIR